MIEQGQKSGVFKKGDAKVLNNHDNAKKNPLNNTKILTIDDF